jgi:adenosylmethionine-8-amino-7-oxononanoate aminotransferase
MKRLNIFSTNTQETSDIVSQVSGHYVDSKFDLHAAGGANIFGYAEESLIETIKENLSSSTSSFWKLKQPVWNKLEEHLDHISNYEYESFLPALTGSDAVDNALKLSWDYWDQKRNVVLVRKNSYHSGSIFGWQMVHSQQLTKKWPQVSFVEFFDDLEETVILVGKDNIACVLIDTIPWNGGLHSNNQEYWNNFQKTIVKNELLLCVDEVLTGIGRMGCWLHSLHLGLKPDMIVLGKALTAGHENLSCTLINDRVTKKISNTWLAIGNTRSVNTMGAVVACAVIEKIINDKTLDYINATIIPYIQSIHRLLETNGIVTTSQGTMIKANLPDMATFENNLHNSGLYHRWDHFWHLSFYNITSQEMKTVKDTLEKIV